MCVCGALRGLKQRKKKEIWDYATFHMMNIRALMCVHAWSQWVNMEKTENLKTGNLDFKKFRFKTFYLFYSFIY